MSALPELPADSALCDAESWPDLLARQDGVVHRRDVPPEHRREVVRLLRRRIWQRASRDVFVNHNGPLTPRQKVWVVVKAAPPGAALAGLTAAGLGGLKGFGGDDAVYLTIPCGTSMPELAGRDIVVHYSRFLTEADVHPVQEPRRTRMPRSVLDAASWARTDRNARAVLLAAVQQRTLRPEHLLKALPTRGPCLRHALIEETIEDAAGGVSSVPEREHDRIVRRFGLPQPTRQQILKRPNGRYYLDADWEEFGLASEVDGIPHMDVLSWDADLDRMNEIVIDRRTLLRFTSYSVRHRPTVVGSTLTRALIARGWDGRSV